MNRILVTGVNGHLGARALEALCPRNEVHAIVRAVPVATRPGVTYHAIDLSGDWSTGVLPDRIDAVIHLAQSRYFREFPQQAMDIFRVNVGATAILLDYASRAGARHFVLASTGGLHRPAETAIREYTKADPPDGPLAYYFRSKQAAELLAGSYKTQMDISVLRPFFIFGPGQSPDKLIPRLVASVREGRPIQLTGQDGLTINPVFIDDVAELLNAILEAPGSRTLMVAGPDAVSIRAIAEMIGREIGRTPVFEQREGDGGSLIADYLAAERLLGRALTGFSEGMRRLLR